MTDRKLEYWVIPPEADAEFVAGMEEVLDTYAAPSDAEYPVLCMDEQPVQLLKETRSSIPATKDHPRRVDYEYERAGTANVFLFCEPLDFGYLGRISSVVGWNRQLDRGSDPHTVDLFPVGTSHAGRRRFPGCWR